MTSAHAWHGRVNGWAALGPSFLWCRDVVQPNKSFAFPLAFRTQAVKLRKRKKKKLKTYFGFIADG